MASKGKSWGKEDTCTGRVMRPPYLALLDQFGRLTGINCSLKWPFSIIVSFRKCPLRCVIKKSWNKVMSSQKTTMWFKTWMWFHFQVIRARRQVKMEPSKRGNSERSGAFSVLVSHYIVVILRNTDEPRLVNIYMMFCDVLYREIHRMMDRMTDPKEAYRRWVLRNKIFCFVLFLFWESLTKSERSTNVSTFYWKLCKQTEDWCENLAISS